MSVCSIQVYIINIMKMHVYCVCAHTHARTHARTHTRTHTHINFELQCFKFKMNSYIIREEGKQSSSRK